MRWLAALACLLVLSVTGASGLDRVCFEAESAAAVTPPMAVVTGAVAAAAPAGKGASAGGYVEIAQGKGNPPEVDAGEAVYAFEAPAAGDYVLWCRVWWDNECGNSLTMVLDGGAPFSFGQDSTYECWHWAKSPPRLTQLTLQAGKHELRVKNREDGIKLDQVLLARNKRYVPVDVEKVTGK